MTRFIKVPQGGRTTRQDAYLVLEHIAAITRSEGGGSYVALLSGGTILVDMSPQNLFLFLHEPSNSASL